MFGITGQIALEEPRLARQADATARDERFDALVRRQARFVFRVAYSVLRSVQDAEDVVQETFLKVYRSAAWERIADEKAFLARAAWRIAVDHRRKAQGDMPECDPPSPGRNPEQAAMASNWDAVLRGLIDALPEELRQPLVLSGFDEFSSRQIAEVMGISEGTVRTRLMRARQILRKKLAALGAGKS